VGLTLMRIGIYAPNLAAPAPSGVERYSTELIRALARLRPAHEIVVLSDAPDLELPPGGRRIHVPTMGRWRRLRFDHRGLARLVREEKLDLLHCTKTFVPAGLVCPAVASVYDVIFLEQPRLYSWAWRQYWTRALRETVSRAAVLLCVSEDAARALVRHHPAARERVKVVPAGVRAEAFSAPVPDGEAVRRRLGVAGRYFLSVGNLTARKNLPVLLRAFLGLPAKDRPGLVVAGRRLDGVAPGGPGVIHLEGATDVELAALYQGALAFVCASEREGFGFPLLEAMAAGVPVLSTRGGALEEVGGEAMLPVPAGDAEALREALERVARDETLRARLVSLGRDRAGRFPWSRCAEGTLEVYERAAAGTLR
jgi:glycosyltransferase involved in cell wall biosynthesis